MQELIIEASVDNLPQVLQFVNDELEMAGCSAGSQMKINLAVEEVFVNIASYAYFPDKGEASIQVEVAEEPVTVKITFMDHGVPYDPLAKQDPDINLPIEDREVGGLGIFLTKKTMDDVTYEYKDGQNILRLMKKI